MLIQVQHADVKQYICVGHKVFLCLLIVVSCVCLLSNCEFDVTRTVHILVACTLTKQAQLIQYNTIQYNS